MKALSRLSGSDLLLARTRAGRVAKFTLFVVGAILPLGSLIWLLLIAHGRWLRRRSDPSPGTALTGAVSPVMVAATRSASSR